MTEQGKKNLDIMIPLIASCAVGYWFFKKYGAKRLASMLVLVGLTFLAVYIATSRLTRSIIDRAPSAAPLPYDLDTKGCNSYDSTATLKAAWDDSQSFWFNNDEPYMQLSQLSDCQLVKAYNDWNKTYYNKAGGKTLAGVISGMNKFSWTARGQAMDNILARLAKKNLT